MMTNDDPVAATHRGLARVWIDFESALVQVPVIARLVGGRLRIDDYRSLLRNLRQQVVEGGRWISRAAASFGPDHEDLRAMFVVHAAAEHRDYRLLERNYVVAGGTLEDIRSAHKNVGSEALSAFMYHSAAHPNPIGMLGAMFIIESLGNRLAGPWADRVAEQLDLPPDALTFLRYHAENDAGHMAEFDRAVALAATDATASATIVRHARVVARLYRLQLEELDNV
ncbi:iron-containing redox enzyme family protein [Sphingomonas montana]|uniref:iron-containing redox enzyme family protein n=1 Tax=Sphingomonas montana TaxID=1843236 RepID=UPI00101AE635|nr:iron-containing redox enzyme family protein [Sphingomonas montana]